MSRQARPSLGFLTYMLMMLLLGLYFIFAAVQGDYGVFRRAEVMAEGRERAAELAALEADVAALENVTRRLSDAYLDLDLLDEQARDILGYVRADEIVIR